MKKLKKKLNKNLRLLFIVVILMSVSGFLLYAELSRPRSEEKKVPVYKYNNSSQVSYKVFLKPNNLFTETIMEEENAYLTSLIDHIETTFNYDFSAEQEATLTGNHQVVLLLEGYMGEDKTYETIWKREFPVTAKESFETKDKKLKVSKNLSINLEPYNNYIQTIAEQTEVKVPVKLSAIMKVNLKADSPKGSLEKIFSPAIEIPLNTAYFKIAKLNVGEEAGALEETQKLLHPLNKLKVTAYSVILAISLLAFLYLIYLRRSMEEEPLVKELDKIFKKYGNRLVALNSEIACTMEAPLTVKSIDDLVRIADEIGKPIFYKHSLDPKESAKFSVYEEGATYVLDLIQTIEAAKALEIKEQFKL